MTGILRPLRRPAVLLALNAMPLAGLASVRGEAAPPAATASLLAEGVPAPPWGSLGHRMAARAAVSTLPAEMPAFFREAGPELAWLAREPDRWRDAASVEMDRAWRYDHYIDFENVPDGALEAPDRFAFLARLHAAGLESPAQDAGLLPYRIVELYQRLVSSWRRWRATPTGSAERRWIEGRIVHDAGILGHYVTDGSQPHHTTIHFDGWAPGSANPEGFTVERGFHARFESDFVDAHVVQSDVDRVMPPRPRNVAGSVSEEVRSFLEASFAAVPELYRIERDAGFDPGVAAVPEARDFAAERLGAGGAMLASLWWSAWVESAARR